MRNLPLDRHCLATSEAMCLQCPSVTRCDLFQEPRETNMNLVQSGVITLASVLVFGAATFAFAQDDPAALYKSKCQVCHGADGKGDTPAGKKLGAKDFHSPEVAKTSDTVLFDITKK